MAAIFTGDVVQLRFPMNKNDLNMKQSHGIDANIVTANQAQPIQTNEIVT